MTIFQLSRKVRRLIQREVLTAQQSLGPHGLRREITPNYCAIWKPLGEGNNPYQHPYHDQPVPLAAHLAALELARAQIDHLQRQAEEAHRMVIQAERAKFAIEAQLGQYQRVLSEQAESLVEERARRMSLEAAKAQAEIVPPLALPEVQPKLNSSKPGWSGRLRRWLGISKQDTA